MKSKSVRDPNEFMKLNCYHIISTIVLSRGLVSFRFVEFDSICQPHDKSRMSPA
jgi:hypothetical protein